MMDHSHYSHTSRMTKGAETRKIIDFYIFIWIINVIYQDELRRAWILPEKSATRRFLHFVQKCVVESLILC